MSDADLIGAGARSGGQINPETDGGCCGCDGQRVSLLATMALDAAVRSDSAESVSPRRPGRRIYRWLLWLVLAVVGIPVFLLGSAILLFVNMWGSSEEIVTETVSPSGHAAAQLSLLSFGAQSSFETIVRLRLVEPSILSWPRNRVIAECHRYRDVEFRWEDAARLTVVIPRDCETRETSGWHGVAVSFQPFDEK